MELIAHHSIPSYFFSSSKAALQKSEKGVLVLFGYFTIASLGSCNSLPSNKDIFSRFGTKSPKFLVREREKIFARECVQACHVTERERES